jgi:TPR repeat protein
MSARECFKRGLELAIASVESDGDNAQLTRAAAVRTLGAACSLGEANACDFAGQLLVIAAPETLGRTMTVSLAKGRKVEMPDTVHPVELKQSAKLFRDGCRAQESPSGAACVSLGDAYAFGIGTTVNVDSAFVAYELGCHLQNATSCARFGVLLETRESLGPSRASEVLTHLDSACEMRSPYGCGRVARWRDVHDVANSDDPQSPAARKRAAEVLRLWRWACAHQEWKSCNNIGYAFGTSLYVPQPNADSADHYFRIACSGNLTGDPYEERRTDRAGQRVDTIWRGDGYACRNIGNAYLVVDSARGVKPDTVKAIEFFRAGCLLFETRACARWTEYSFDLFKSDSTHPLAAKPLEAFVNASASCREDVSGEACNTAAWLLRQDELRDLPRSVRLPKSVRLYARACDLGYSWSCYQAGNVETYDLDDRTNGMKFYRRGCNLGEGQACEVLATSLEKTFSLADQTLALLEKACDLGRVESCWRAQRIHRDRGNEMEEGIFRAKACRLDPKYCKKENAS